MGFIVTLIGKVIRERATASLPPLTSGNLRLRLGQSAQANAFAMLAA